MTLKLTTTDGQVIDAGARIFCIGHNYHDHAKETGAVAPEVPNVFVRFASSLVMDDADRSRYL